MNDQPRPSERHPVVTGVVALVAVGLVVGLVLGGVAWAGARFAGLGGDGSAAGDPSATSAEDGDRMVLPRAKETEANPDPLITLAPIPGGESPSAAPREREEEEDEPEIVLSAGQEAVGVFGQIDLTGQYADGDGRVLQVERYEGDTWVEFNATVAVTAGSFSTFVQSGQTGPNRFRMVDSSDGTTSNPVTVRVG
ncbi:hypothetical protein [Nocardioides sp. AX2bis]|uniref:hypothetical protein n=1 Tax=Nocardioides sp. AX2bis TaxID=2653157 RepID=UPI0012F3D8D6|nr:hypothetical protein [Nocardioides sp. AX2bis]VXC28142.1 conserved hypothetical protein [Nocardioides sp. AX2bis]